MTGRPDRTDRSGLDGSKHSSEAGRHGGTGAPPVHGADQQSAPSRSSRGIGQDLNITRRDLPHWQAGGSTYFITFRLQASARGSTRPGAGIRGLSARERWVVRDDILFWHGRRWMVHALTVMPDHVHILATPLEMAAGRWWSLSTILCSVKSGSALKINRMRGRRGALWQTESFDRIVRDEREFDEKANYILSNAVKAELVKDGWEYDGLWCPGMDAGTESTSIDSDSNGRGRRQRAD